MIHPVNQAFDLIAWSGRRLAWPAIYVIYGSLTQAGATPTWVNAPRGQASGLVGGRCD